MKNRTRELYQAQEFANRMGVTVRTLHHYDQLGLLKPSGYSRAGFRLYGEADVVRLQQIVTLKFIGFTLKQIKALLDQDSSGLLEKLRRQREIIEQKRRHLEIAIQVIAQAEETLGPEDDPDWSAFKRIIEVINMQNNIDWVKQYYTAEQLAELAERGTPEVCRQGEQDWAVLIKEVEASLGEDPASEHAQSLAARWQQLIGAFTGGNPEIEANLKRLYADQNNWPTTFQKPYSDEATAFIQKAIAIGKEKG